MFTIPYRYVTEEEAIERRKREALDTSWHLVHYFERGWRWHRHSDNVDIGMSDLKPYGVAFKYFPHIDSKVMEDIVNERKERDRKELEWRKANPIKIDILSEIVMPKIKGGFPELSINDIVGVQPMGVNNE